MAPSLLYAANVGTLSCSPFPCTQAQECIEKIATGETDADSRFTQVVTNQVLDKDDR
jgi:hypothetical protein